LRRPGRRDQGEALAPPSGCSHAAQQWAVIGPGRCNRSLCVTTPPADRRLEPVCAGRWEETAPPAVGIGRTDLLPYPQHPPTQHQLKLPVEELLPSAPGFEEEEEEKELLSPSSG
ncbi:hypothetical protein Celaphus_00000836, partial [Cervus elaphus hippelaphus]